VRDEGSATPTENPERGQPMSGRQRAALAAGTRDFGAELFEAVFKGKGLKVFFDTEAEAQRMGQTGVRIRISMNLENGTVEAAGLPWELMCQRGEDPLGLFAKSPIVRSFALAESGVLQPIDGMLKVLVVMSNPKGTPALKLKEERDRLLASWKALNVAVDFMDFVNRPVSRDEFRTTLAGDDYHVVHFMGHGDFDANQGGVLLFEHDDADRSPDPVSARDFAVMLKDEPLRLVYLNACKTGVTRAGSIHPFASVAAALFTRGVPAVVAMQFPISDRAAIDFATTFYARLAQGHPVDAAVSQARNKLYTTDGPSEWATPVLYLRTRDGVLFAPAAGVETASTGAGQDQAAGPEVVAAVNVWGAGAADAPRVFLAASCETLNPLRRRLARELLAEGIRVNDAVPPPHEAVEHDARVNTLAEQADLCVHLMGDTPGEPMDEDGYLRAYPVHQLRLLLQGTRPQFVVIPDVDVETIEDAEYKGFLGSLGSHAYSAHRFELVRIGGHEVKAAIMANLQRQKDARAAALVQRGAGTTVRTAFVDAHDRDWECADKLVTFLSQRHVDAFMQTSEGSASDDFSQFGNNLKDYPLYIIVAGKADQAWVAERTNNARSSASKARVPMLIGKYEGADDPTISMSRLKIVAALKRPAPTPVDALFMPPDGGKA